MLSISFVNSKDQIIKHCQKHKRVYSPAYYLYTANDRTGELACGFFEIKSDQVEVLGYQCLDPEDHNLFDGILRAGFNYASENGINVGVISEEFRHQFNNMFDKLNFTNQSVFDINNFFKKYKNCHN